MTKDTTGQGRMRRGLPLRAVAPNAVTALALCFGLTGVRFAISAAADGADAGDWGKAVACIIIAGVLDGLDGRIARLLKGESRFGAELDSLSDVIAFGVSPAVIVYLWSLQTLPKFGWIFALSVAVCCALRLARFNANIDVTEQPHKSAGFLTGIPAPAGAGCAMLPIYLWLWSGEEIFRQPWIVAPWIAFIAFLMISNVATFSWSALRLRREWRLGALVAVGLLGAALLSDPWISLTCITVVYVLLVPFGIRSYSKVKRARKLAAQSAPA